MQLSCAKTTVMAILTAGTLGWAVAATAMPVPDSPLLLAQKGGQCRRIINNVGGPDQPRAVAGLDNNQIPVYTNPGDIYDSAQSPVKVLAIGDRVTLADPYQESLVSPGDTTAATIMVAIRDEGETRWIPVTDARRADGRPMGPSNLGMCSVQALW